ncbi:MAG: AHH domain-containing protein [Muribaculaceae bacterium]|nr:AHH domain-containing protein [Muribaculaceae bacterium]
MNKQYKHIISMVLAGWIAILSSGALAQTTTQNYIHTIEAGKKSKSSPDQYFSDSTRSSIQYLDGLGRPVQTVLVKQGGDYYDIVSKTEYNYLNKVAKEWLPIEGSFNGAFITASEYAQKASSYYDNDEPYTLTTYQTYTDGVHQVFKPGHYRRYIKSETNRHSISDCRWFSYDGNGTLVAKGYYPESTVIATSSEDEDGKKVIEVSDREGRTILRRAIADNNQYADTYFVYDIYGDLRYMISPKASALLPLNGSCDAEILRSLCYYYEYDLHHRVTLKRLPGVEPIYYVYDKLSRPIFSQDGVQRASSKWSVIKYDPQKRVAVEGIATISGATRESLQAIWGDSTIIAVPKTTGNINEIALMYSTNCGPSSFTAQRAYFYDDYSHWGNYPIPSDADYTINTSLSAQGLLTGTAVYDNSGNCIVEAIFYDDRGREVMRCERDYYANASSATTFNKYSFRGLLLSKKCVASQLMEGTVTTSHNVEWKYTHDGGDRVTTTQMRVDGGNWKEMSGYRYDEVGRLSRKTFGKYVSAGGNNVINYDYHIHGNISSISSPWYSQRLYYGENPFNPSQVYRNGNLCASTSTVVNTTSDFFESELTFSYEYDKLNQLRSAIEDHAGTDIGEYFDYDLNGNIVNLERMFDGYYVQRAAITYDGNQIVSVNDASEDESTGMAPRFPSGVYSDAVAYDANGNITRDDTRAISSVTYHPYLNLPKQVNFADGSYLQWDYRPDGKKVKSTSSEKYIRVTVTVNSRGDTIVRERTMYNTDMRKYIGAFEISGNTWRVYHDAGHTDIIDSLQTHRYYVQDYLGSTRAVVDEDGNVLQSTAYYPSGVPLTPNSLTPQTIKLHTGKDFFDLQGAGWYDNQARYYDCLIPTFKSQDPLAEKYPWLSPYNHCANNPLRFVDPDGKQIFLTPNPLLGTTNPLLISNNHPITTANRISNTTSKTPNPTEIHHIIPKSLKGNDIVKQAIKDGFKLDGKENKIGIEKFNRATNTGRHAKHPNYTKKVQRLLEKNAKDDTPLNAVKETIKELKQKIENNPETKINDLFSKTPIAAPVDNTFIKTSNDIVIINTY